MKLLACAAAIAVSAGTLSQAQEPGNAPSPGSSATTEQPGRSGQRINEPAAQGSQGNKADTLMDKRAKAMSPQGASTPGKTGEVRQ
jgi:hypothetical protein